jgi:glyoxylase-like metal-dependent hydrolase (beta-lactamase superfamily II)
MVIDPGGDFDRIRDRLRTLRVTVDAILLTHGHVDHVGAAADLQRLTSAPVRLHGADRFVYDLVPLQAAMLGFSAPAPAEVDASLVDGATLLLGACEIRVLHTPGHSPGSVGFLLEQGPEIRLFAGDTLFRGGVGRTDLWGGDEEALLRSIRSRLLTLPDHTVVVPGHGELTTIGQERRTNPLLADA